MASLSYVRFKVLTAVFPEVSCILGVTPSLDECLSTFRRYYGLSKRRVGATQRHSVISLSCRSALWWTPSERPAVSTALGVVGLRRD
jgi:hypothetical protein